MKNKEISLFSLAKITAQEILIEEQLKYSGTSRYRQFKIYTANENNLKKKIITSKILGAVIFGILPVIPFLTYFKISDYIENSNISIYFILFTGSIFFGIFFLLQFFNFFLMSLLNITKIMSGKIFEWYESLPVHREKLRKLLLLTIIRSSDIPLIVITIALPTFLLIGTQDLIIFVISLLISILNTIFSLSILILFAERLNRIMDINEINDKKTRKFRIINMISYVVIIIGSIFFIEWSFSSLDPVFDWFVNQEFPEHLILIFSMIPFPISPGYFISSFIAPNQIPFRVWYNIFVGICLFLILTWLIYGKSLKGIKKNSYSKFRLHKKSIIPNFTDDGFPVRIKVTSPIKAYIRKDLLIATHDLKNFMSIIMPIILGFIFTITYNMTNVGGLTPLDLDFIINWFAIIGFNLIISGMLVYGLISIEESGESVLASLPFIPRDQAKAKLILMSIIQSITLIAPTLMYINNAKFITLFLSTLGALPIVLILLFLMFEMRVYFFGRMKHFYVLDEIFPEKKMAKWTYIFLILFIIQIFIQSTVSIIFITGGFMVLTIFLTIIFFVGFFIVFLIFDSMFPKPLLTKKIIPKSLPISKKDSIMGAPMLSIHNPLHSILLLLTLSLIFRYFIILMPFPKLSPYTPFENIANDLFRLNYLLFINLIYASLWIFIVPVILGIPDGKRSIKEYLDNFGLGWLISKSKAIIWGAVIVFLILLFNYIFSAFITYSFLLTFSFIFWQELAFRGVILRILLNKVRTSSAIIIHTFLYLIYQLVNLLIFGDPTGESFYYILTFSIYIFSLGFLLSFLFIRTNNNLLSVLVVNLFITFLNPYFSIIQIFY